jgi:hypothetical protein
LRLRNAFGDRFVSTAAAKPIIITVNGHCIGAVAAPTEGKIAIATSQGYFMELLCRYWKIRKRFMSSGTMGGRFW